MNEITIAVSLAKDLWNLIHKARHPHFESEIVDAVKGQLAMKLQEAAMQQVPVPPSKPEEDNANAV
jgi:hypothetical protein